MTIPAGVRYYILDVFASRAFRGNQLAVVCPDVALETAALQQIAAEFGFSETVFLYPGDSLEVPARMRIFTPRQELPFAGHPTLGTAALLLLRPRIARQRSQIRLAQPCGVVGVAGEAKDDTSAYTELTMPFLPRTAACPLEPRILADLLQIDSSVIGFAGYQAEIVSAGPTFLFIPVRSIAALYGVRLDVQVWNLHLENTEFSNIYVFAHDTGDTFHARMFAPNMGQTEDAATGAAAGGLAFYLNDQRSPAPYPDAVIRQGVVLGRDSELRIRYEDAPGVSPRIVVGGSSVLISAGELLAVPEGPASVVAASPGERPGGSGEAPRWSTPFPATLRKS